LLYFCIRYGHLTWEWQKGIRSYIHPLIIAGVYKLLAFFALDTLPLLVSISIRGIFQSNVNLFQNTIFRPLPRNFCKLYYQHILITDFLCGTAEKSGRPF
jgi:Alg9-like mannosyltransferase family